MSNATVPAADAGLPKLNRRSALAKLGLGAVAVGASVATASAFAEAAVSPELLRLIEAHRAAYAALDRAIVREMKAEVAFEAAMMAIREQDWPTIADFASAQDQAEKSGLSDAELDDERAMAFKEEALMALCSYRCANFNETSMKAEYLSEEASEGQL